MIKRLKNGKFSLGDITVSFAVLFLISLIFKIQGLEIFSLLVLIITSFAAVFEMTDEKHER